VQTDRGLLGVRSKELVQHRLQNLCVLSADGVDAFRYTVYYILWHELYKLTNSK